MLIHTLIVGSTEFGSYEAKHTQQRRENREMERMGANGKERGGAKVRAA